jgi:peptidyl-prolyl cis-trans isomerase C
MHATYIPSPVASINQVPLHRPGESLPPEALRQRACSELLRQAAQSAGLLEAGDPAGEDGILSDAASAAIDVLLERALAMPAPSPAACQRHYDAHQAKYRTGERVRVRHILFAVTPGTNVVALRNRAEACLLDVRCHDGSAGEHFASAARDLSNCPSAEHGGDLDWLVQGDCAPEFARELFGKAEVGVLPRLVHSRFGLHVVEVLAREPGHQQAFDAVRGAVAMALQQKAFVSALQQYLRILAGQAALQGVDLAAADSPLVQ